MSMHKELGDITVAVGIYESGGTTKKRYRKIGVLMETTEAGQPPRQWMRLNADIFHASLFSLLFRTSMGKGDDSVIAQVFAERTTPKTSAAEPVGDDDIPY